MNNDDAIMNKASSIADTRSESYSGLSGISTKDSGMRGGSTNVSRWKSRGERALALVSSLLS